MIKNKKLSKKVLFVAGALILLVAIGAYFLLSRQNNSEQVAENTGQTQPQPDINFNPPTPEDAQRVEDNKEQILKNQQVTPAGQTTPDGKKSVKPTITYAGQYGDQVEAGAYVSGVLEDFGVCKAVFQKDSEAITVQVEAVRGANSMDCPVMGVPVNELKQKGTWSVTVSYSSNTAAGGSDSRQLEVK